MDKNVISSPNGALKINNDYDAFKKNKTIVTMQAGSMSFVGIFSNPAAMQIQDKKEPQQEVQCENDWNNNRHLG